MNTNIDKLISQRTDVHCEIEVKSLEIAILENRIRNLANVGDVISLWDWIDEMSDVQTEYWQLLSKYEHLSKSIKTLQTEQKRKNPQNKHHL